MTHWKIRCDHTGWVWFPYFSNSLCFTDCTLAHTMGS